MSEQAAVERWLAWRYLATRQREGFVSFIAIFSLIGIALGVATLIVVLSVMGGFRASLIGRLIGMNGHIVVAAQGRRHAADLARAAGGAAQRARGQGGPISPWNGRRWSAPATARPAAPCCAACGSRT